MSMIDLNNLDKLSPQQREQFNDLLKQFPHLEPKLKPSRELNTPSRQEMLEQGLADENELDYSDFLTPDQPTKKRELSKKDLPQIKVDPQKRSFMSSFEDEDREKEIKEALKPKKENRKRKSEKEPEREKEEFSPVGKVHPILQKMRMSMGLKRQETVSITLGGCEYTFRALDRKSVAQATSLASNYVDNPVLYTTTIEEALLAYSIIEIDRVPVSVIFDIPRSKIEKGVEYPIYEVERDQLAAKEMFHEIRKLPPEVVENLGIFYRQEFPPLQILGADKTKFLCPEPYCMQSRIASVTETCYCPVHGTEMQREESLPNPS